MDDAADETTTDGLMDGRIRLTQPARGYRAGMDAALLAATVEVGPGQRLLELGCGAGGALLQAAVRNPEARLVGLERDPAMLALAQANILANGLGDRVEALAGDVAGGFRATGLDHFDHVIANPPFFDDPRALRTPKGSKRTAFLSDEGLRAWLDFMLKATRPGAGLTVIQRADRLADLLEGLGNRAGGIAIRPIHPYTDQKAGRVLVRAHKGSRAPLSLLPPLVLHDREGGGHTPEAEALLRGRLALAM